MIQQVEFSLRPFPRGFHLVTNEVLRQLPALPKTGILNLFVRHTSCGLSLNENFDPDVRYDLKGIFERLVPDEDPRYLHQDEGPTDMSAHAKSSMVGVSLTIPITNGRLNLGTSEPGRGYTYASLEKAAAADISSPQSWENKKDK